jgi:hypothetical protein
MRHWARLSLVAAAVLELGCSWQRFDEVSENAPIVLLKKPNKLESGFGVSLATATLDDQVLVLSTGSAPASPGAVFDLGPGEAPGLDARDTGSCDSDECALAAQPAGLARSRTSADDQELCFAVGTGTSSNADGIVVRCLNEVEYGLEIPNGAKEFVLDPLLDGTPELLVPLVLASDASETPALLAGVPFDQRAWFYAPNGFDFVALPAPGDDESFGTTLAVLRIGDDARIFAIGAPEEGHVWLFRSDDGESAFPIGCLGGVSGFGRALASGFVDDDEIDELLVSDDFNVTIFDGRSLIELPRTESEACSLGGLHGEAIVTSFGCGSNGATTGCDEARFGAAIAVGDLDGDGDGEVIVGAPGMTVRDTPRAGALLVFDVEGDRPWEFDEIQFLSSAEEGDQLGATVVAPEQGDRAVIAAGAPGNGKTAVFFCSSLLPEDRVGARCR